MIKGRSAIATNHKYVKTSCGVCNIVFFQIKVTFPSYISNA